MRVRSQLEPVLEKEKMGEDKIIVSEEGSWEEKKDHRRGRGWGSRGPGPGQSAEAGEDTVHRLAQHQIHPESRMSFHTVPSGRLKMTFP